MEADLSEHGTATILVLLIGAAVLAPWIAPHDPAELHLADRLQGPSVTYPFGTDHLGRCVFSRVLFGARLSLGIAIAVVATTAGLGTLVGLTAGYVGGFLDEVVMRGVDSMLAVPSLVLALVIAGLLGPGIPSIVVALSLAGWMRYTRAVRGIVRSVKTRAFIDATRVLGASESYILPRRILPEVLPTVLVLAALGMASTVLTIAALSFLGLGLQPPAAEWGSMLQSGHLHLRAAPHLVWFPGLAILFTVAAFQILAESLRQRLDPRGLTFPEEALAPRG